MDRLNTAIAKDSPTLLSKAWGDNRPIDTLVKRKETLLIRCTRKDARKCVLWCLKRGANPNATNIDGSNPLVFAIDSPLVMVLEQLLSYGAYPNARSRHGPKYTTPFRAMEFRNRTPYRTAITLYEYGANRDPTVAWWPVTTAWDDIMDRVNRCKRSIAVFIIMCKRSGMLYKDLRTAIAQRVWSARRQKICLFNE